MSGCISASYEKRVKLLKYLFIWVEVLFFILGFLVSSDKSFNDISRRVLVRIVFYITFNLVDFFLYVFETPFLK